MQIFHRIIAQSTKKNFIFHFFQTLFLPRSTILSNKSNSIKFALNLSISFMSESNDIKKAIE